MPVYGRFADMLAYRLDHRSLSISKASPQPSAYPCVSWERLFKSRGMKNPIPRIQMLDGLNEGWIDFERGRAGTQKGRVALEVVLEAMIEPEVGCPGKPLFRLPVPERN
jgi:hypothetical protein